MDWHLWASEQRRALIVALALAFAWTFFAKAAPIDVGDVRVIDADTIRLDKKGPDVRLLGFDAPETRRSACEGERQLGGKARERLRELVRGSKLDFELVACSCPAGTEGTPKCNYGRRCGTLKADGRDVGEILIAEGLAIPSQCRASPCPETPRPWCK